ncbi:MAG: hypothetical protein LBV67_04450 [Streptococcaceae bacterium]|jgi:hypothetical protein|nr:hypothetical protein [Streptococcaceae bacterium]
MVLATSYQSARYIFLGLNSGELITIGLAVVAVIISIFTLRQNSKMIQESLKPDIQIYIETVDNFEAHKYLVIKNFGNSSAFIESILFDKAISSNTRFSMKSLEKSTIASKQKFMTLIDANYKDNVIAVLTYSYKIGYFKKTKKEEISLNFA